jgi:Putative zinc-finger
VSMSHVDDGMLHGYLDGELSPADAQDVDAHVAQCPDCRRRLDEERALIARAAELLALAAPPDRELPPFRTGDVKAPTRLWWQVRLPLAWAATVALALGIGTYLGREETPAPEAGPATGVAAVRPRAPEEPVRELAERESRREAPGAARTPPARARVEKVALPPPEPAASRADSAAARLTAGQVAPRGGNPWQKGSAISVDSARRVLGTDPFAVPGLPIEALYRGHDIGYSGVVIVEQALDATTMIEVITARNGPAFLNPVDVTQDRAAVPDSMRAGRVRGARLARVADSLAIVPMAAPGPASLAGRPGPDLFRDVRGPLPPDSLAALRRRLQPLRPVTGP